MPLRGQKPRAKVPPGNVQADIRSLSPETESRVEPVIRKEMMREMIMMGMNGPWSIE